MDLAWRSSDIPLTCPSWSLPLWTASAQFQIPILLGSSKPYTVLISLSRVFLSGGPFLHTPPYQFYLFKCSSQSACQNTQAVSQPLTVCFLPCACETHTGVDYHSNMARGGGWEGGRESKMRPTILKLLAGELLADSPFWVMTSVHKTDTDCVPWQLSPCGLPHRLIEGLSSCYQTLPE